MAGTKMHKQLFAIKAATLLDNILVLLSLL